MIQVERLRFRKGDWVAIAGVIVLAVAVFLCFLPGRAEPSGQADIFLNGEKIRTVDLLKDQTFVISERYNNEIQVKDGTICISDSDCPGRDCVHSGSISTRGRSLVCLPNGLEIRITSAEADVDFVVR